MTKSQLSIYITVIYQHRSLDLKSIYFSIHTAQNKIFNCINVIHMQPLE